MNDSPIERYLDELVRELAACPPRQLRHLLTETEAHLRDDAAAAMAAGVPESEAEAQAIARFGPAAVVGRDERAAGRLPYGVLARQVITSTALLGGIGAVVVGVSGVLAALLSVVGGARFVVDVTPGQSLSPGDCARWLSQHPSAVDCHAAAVSDWIGEVVWYRIAVGLLGVVALGVWRLLRRGAAGQLPAAVDDTIAATLFATAALGSGAVAVDMIAVNSGRASGQWISAAVAASVPAMVFAIRLARDLRTPREFA